MYWVYILECGDGSLYTGIARDVEARVRQHLAGTGSKFVRSRGVCGVVYRERKRTRGSALRREGQIKAFDRKTKLRLIADVAQG